MATADIISQYEGFLLNVSKQTKYESDLADEASYVFSRLQQGIHAVIASPEGTKLIQKYTVLSTAISTEGTFNDMVKIIWRMVKTMSGSAEHKLMLMMLGICTIVCSLRKTKGCVDDTWVANMEVWLGGQLTIGGKGVTGEGEGTVSDRIRRFFSTPYLHDFD